MTLNELFARFDKLASVSADSLPPPSFLQQSFEPLLLMQLCSLWPLLLV